MKNTRPSLVFLIYRPNLATAAACVCPKLYFCLCTKHKGKLLQEIWEKEIRLHNAFREFSAAVKGESEEYRKGYFDSCIVAVANASGRL